MATARTHGVRRVERWIVGTVMAVLALVIERVVVRSIRRGEISPRPTDPTSVTAAGTDVRAG